MWPYLVLPGCLLFLVLLGPAYYLLSVAQYGTLESSPDANIGAALGIMWTAGWGLPWSLWPWNSPTFSRLTGHQQELVLLGCALVNVVLVGLFMMWRWRRAARRERAQAG